MSVSGIIKVIKFMTKNILSEGRHTIEISYKTIVFTVFFIIFLAVVRQIEGILVGIFVSYLIMAAVNPLVNILEKFKIPVPFRL